MKVCYCIHESEDFAEGSVLLAVFKDKQKAEKYTEIQRALIPYANIWMTEEKFMDDSFSIDTKVAQYYMYSVDINNSFSIEQLDEMNEGWSEPEPCIWRGDNFVEVKSECDYFTGYSTESNQKAREVALDYLEVLQGMKKNTNYKVIEE